MISINDLIKSVSNMIYKAIEGSEYKCRIVDDEDQLQTYIDKQEACFFIDVGRVNSSSVNLHFNKKSLVIDINYFPQKQRDRPIKRDVYEVKSLLESVFVRSVKVGKRYIHIENVDSNVLNDNIGAWLSFSISLSYHEQVLFDKNADLIQDIKLKHSDVLKIESEV